MTAARDPGVIVWPGKWFVKLAGFAPFSPLFFGLFRPFPATPHFRAIYSTGEPFTGFGVRIRVVFEQHLGEG